MNCLRCAAAFEQKTWNQKFCSSKCHNNHAQRIWQQTHKKPCGGCGHRLVKHENLLCRICGHQRVLHPHTTMGEVRSRYKSRYQWTSILRGHARSLAGNQASCYLCSYSKHIEVCHIQSLASFPMGATVGEVNSKNNLTILCRNCHWEFDNGLMSEIPPSLQAKEYAASISQKA